MARELDMSDIRRTVLRIDIVVLGDTGRVEVVHEGLLTAGEIVLVDLFHLGYEGAALFVGAADGAEAVPKRLMDIVSFEHLIIPTGVKSK